MTDPDTPSQPASQPLQPPAATDSVLTLTAPPPVQAVTATAAPSLAPAVPATALPGLDAKVEGYLAMLMAAAPRSPEFAAKATDVRSMGDEDIRRAAETSNSLLKSPVRAIQEGGLAEGSKVGSTLLELRRTVEELDPKEATGTKKLLGFIPFGDRLTDYFHKYQSAQSHLDAILHALRDGQDELGKDNAALNLEKQQLWEAMSRLNQYVYVAERLDARLAAAIADIEAFNPEKAKALRDDVMFYVRQKHQDLLTQLAVSIQNYLAIDIVIKNNIELIKGGRPSFHHDDLSVADGGHGGPGARQPTARAHPDLGAEHHDVRSDRAHLGDAARQLGRHPATGRVGHDRVTAAAGRLPEHLRHHGRHRHVQGPGPGQHGRHDRHPGDRGQQVPRVPRTG